MSVIVKDDEDVIRHGDQGGLEEMLAISSHVEYKKRITELTEEIRQEIPCGSGFNSMSKGLRAWLATSQT